MDTLNLWHCQDFKDNDGKIFGIYFDPKNYEHVVIISDENGDAHDTIIKISRLGSTLLENYRAARELVSQLKNSSSGLHY